MGRGGSTTGFYPVVGAPTAGPASLQKPDEAAFDYDTQAMEDLKNFLTREEPDEQALENYVRDCSEEELKKVSPPATENDCLPDWGRYVWSTERQDRYRSTKREIDTKPPVLARPTGQSSGGGVSTHSTTTTRTSRWTVKEPERTFRSGWGSCPELPRPNDGSSSDGSWSKAGASEGNAPATRSHS